MATTKAFKEIIKLGHPTLRKVAVPFTTSEMVAPNAQKLVKRMKDVLRATDSGIGLAAPQIDVQKQLVVVEVRPLDTFGGRLKGIEPTPFFNPVLELQGEEDVLMLESCLSVPDLCGFVSRRKRLTMYYWNDQAKPMKLKAIGYWSGLIQHETDHLFGKVYIDRLNSSKDLFFVSEVRKHINKLIDGRELCDEGEYEIEPSTPEEYEAAKKRLQETSSSSASSVPASSGFFSFFNRNKS